MQFLDISHSSNESLKRLANKISEMKHMSVPSINNTLAKLRSSPPTLRSSMKIMLLFTMGTPIMTTIILALIIITT